MLTTRKKGFTVRDAITRNPQNSAGKTLDNKKGGVIHILTSFIYMRNVTVIVTIAVTAILISAYIIFSQYSAARPVRLSELKLKTKYVHKAFFTAAEYVTRQSYTSRGKKIKTRDGMYTAEFYGDINKVFATLVYTCCGEERNTLSGEFKTFFKSNYSRVLRSGLWQVILAYYKKVTEEDKQKKYAFLTAAKTLTAEEFFELTEAIDSDYVGVYALFNKSKKMYYVGQAKHMFAMIKRQFAGDADKDIYADYKYGDKFLVKIVRLTDSGYSNLDKLEKVTAEKYGIECRTYCRTGKQ